jgi:TnpA family transposase
MWEISPRVNSPKKGIVNYTHVANHVPLNARIIGANEHESHYVFDLLYNNTTDIQPSIHATDTHGTNEVNFAFFVQSQPPARTIVIVIIIIVAVAGVSSWIS